MLSWEFTEAGPKALHGCFFFLPMGLMQDGAFEVKKAGNKMRKFAPWSLLVLDVIICNVVNFLR